MWALVPVDLERSGLGTPRRLEEPFISGMKELSSIIMLATPDTEVLTTLSVRLVDYGYTNLANVVVLILVAITFGATFIVQRLTRAGLASGLEG